MSGPKLRVVQCWDDGNVDDIRLCELLRQHRAKASFNLNPDHIRDERWTVWHYQDRYPVIRLTLAEMRDVYAGFTIANHTLTHPRPTQLSLSEWRREVVDARHRLQDAFQQPVLGFAYPFGECTPETAAIVGEAGHVYGRTIAQATPCFPPADPLAFAPDCHVNAADFWQRYEAAKRSPGRVFYFWGHSYEFTDEAAWSAYAAILERIAADPETVWTDLPALFISDA